jgi:hypothetical protein
MRFLGLLILLLPLAAFAQTTHPVGSRENPREITSKDRGPDRDPRQFASQPFAGIPLFRTFRSFMSGLYAVADVWVYADGDEQKLYDTQLAYTYPEFYTPTYGELFDHVARQMRCNWEWNPTNRQFKFARTSDEPFFSVMLEKGWRREDRGMYVWHAPPDQDFGMDIYYFGHFTGDAALAKKVRQHFAEQQVSMWPTPPTVKQMTESKVGADKVDALYLRIDTPRPGGLWRQWSFVTAGHAFVIVSAMPKEKEAELAPQVDRMVQSFELTHRAPATTRTASTQPSAP